jgi:hypothetical protein
VAEEGKLTILSNPEGARIFIDGAEVGRAPVPRSLPYGSHRVKAELDGYKPETRTIDVRSAELSVPFDLEPLMVTGTVTLLGPTGAEVILDGNPVGTLPTQVKLSAGTHRFEVVMPDGKRFNRSENIQFASSGGAATVQLSP